MATYVLRARSRFEAAHHLRSYRGAPEPAHGHSWRVEAAVEAPRLDPEGIGFDFVRLKEALNALAERLHHRDLNDVEPFDRLAPTTEHVAGWFFERLREALPDAPLKEVTVWEGPDCSATYRPS